MSESFVLYTHAPEKLPADVKAWFDLLHEYSQTGKLPAREKMPSVAFKPERKRKASSLAISKNETPTALTEAQRKRRDEIQQEAKSLYKKKRLAHPQLGENIVIPNKAIKEWLNQPFYDVDAKNEMLLTLEEVLPKAEYKGISTWKLKQGIRRKHILETKINDKKCWIILHEMEWGEVKIHSISQFEKVLDNIIKAC